MRSILLGLAIFLAGCSKHEETTHSHQTEIHTPTPAEAHTHAHTHAPTNQQTISKSLTLLDLTFDLLAEGQLIPDNEYHVEMVVVDGPLGATVRLWIGDASGVGSMKTKADIHGEQYHAHVLVPKDINDTTALWVEVRTIGGNIALDTISLQ
ncbi:MAG: hypothetical protein QGI78_09075 [Phycisphaerales bacterium]|jgi:uncharacterized protein YceK|nr:hypothetical protein [Phycisphaerales bacterium]